MLFTPDKGVSNVGLGVSRWAMKWNINAHNEIGGLHLSPEVRFTGKLAAPPPHPPLPWNPAIVKDPLWASEQAPAPNQLPPDQPDEWKNGPQYAQVASVPLTSGGSPSRNGPCTVAMHPRAVWCLPGNFVLE